MENVDYGKQRQVVKRRIGQSLVFLASVLVAVSVQQALTNDQPPFPVRILSLCTMMMCFLQSTLVYIAVDDMPTKPPPPPPETSTVDSQETSIRTPPCLQNWVPRPGSEELVQRLIEAQSRQAGYFGAALECFIKEGTRTTTGYFIPTAPTPTCDGTDEQDNEYSEAIECPATAIAPGSHHAHVGRDEPDAPTNPELGNESPTQERTSEEK